MKYKSIACAAALLMAFASYQGFGQSGLHVSNGTSLFIKSGTALTADGLVLIPSTDYTITGENTLTRTTTVTNPNPNTAIGRVYRFTPVLPAFSGSVGIRFLDAELNNLTKSNLTLNIFDGVTWNNQTNVSRTENGNLVTASDLSNISLQELTLSAGTITPDLTLNPASFCSADNNSYALGATPTGGVWTGNGVVENADGSYSFRPSIAGPGNHQLTYTLPSDAGAASLTASVAGSPNVYSVTGGGSYCSGDAGAPIGLAASDAGLIYQLYGPAGTVVATQTGTGAALSFGAFTQPGVYYVLTTTNGCARTMEGAAVVAISPAATAAITAGGATTFCPGGSVILSANEGSSYLWSNGATTRSITVTQSGDYSVKVTNSSGCDATSPATTVVVEDNQAPQITFCPAPAGDAGTIVRGSEGCAYLIRSVEFNTAATDDCSGPLTYSYTLSGATTTKVPMAATSLGGVSLNQGITTITWTVRDASGNSSTCSFSVEVKDLTAPMLYIPSDITLECTGASSYDNTGSATASDNCDDAVSITYSDEISYGQNAKPVLIIRTWTATDENGNQTSGVQRIDIVDTTPPVVPTLPDITAQCSATVPPAPVATDACGGTITGTTHDPLTYNTQGTHIVTWTFTDAIGNTTTQTQRVVIRDNTAPVLQGYVASNIAADCHAVPAAPEVSALDNCDAAPVVTLQETTTKGTDPNAREFYNYTITRSWTATDEAGNQAVIASQVVTVTDRHRPTISFNPRITRFADAGRCGAQTFVSKPQGVDACSPVTITNNLTGTGNLPQFYPVGTTTIEWTATDVSGNFSQVTTVITVIDNQFPQGTAPADVTVENDRGSCTASGVNLGTPSVTDNCGIKSISNNAPAVFPIGTTEVVWTVVDESGNTSYFRQNIIVQDTEKPTIIGPADVSETADAGSCHASGINLGTPTTSDNCTIASVSNDAPVVFPVGTTVVTWTVIDASGNTTTATQNVMVADNEMPVITAPAAITRANDAGQCSASGIALGTPVTSDNCTVAAVTNDAPASFPVGTTVVTWTVTDASGNTATATQTVTVRDEEKPTITAPAAVVISTEPGTCLPPSLIQTGTPVTSDNCGVASVGIHSDTKITFVLGDNFITWMVIDLAGNTATAIQKVTLVDTEKPKLTAPASISVSNDAGTCGAVVSLGTASASDNCTLASVTNNAPATFPVGTTVITWTATDAAGNSVTATQTVVVTDNEKPVVSCPALPTSYCYNVGGYHIPQLTATDNCGIESVVYSITGATNRTGSGYDPGTSFNTGSSVITWTVKDIHGNESTCQATVVVIDPMVVSIPDTKALPAGVAPNTVYIGYSPAASVTLTAQVSGGSGNYSYLWSNGATTASITVSPSVVTTYTVTVTDDKGCSKTASQQVNVVDVRCGNNLDKVLVCHIPEGNTSKQHNVCVSVSAVATHLATGDYLGVCGGQITQPLITDVKLVEFTIEAMPNPSITYFTLKLNSTSDLPIKMRVTDMWGRVLETRDNLTPGSTIELGSKYRAGAYFVEVIQGLEWRHVKLIKTAN